MLTRILNLRKEWQIAFLLELIRYVKNENCFGDPQFLCHHYPNHHKFFGFCCWKKLTVVKNNDQSKHIAFWGRGNLTCNDPMFEGNKERILFLKECILILDPTFKFD